MTQDQILNNVVNETLFGMVEVDIEVPDHLTSYFEEMSQCEQLIICEKVNNCKRDVKVSPVERVEVAFK